MDINETSQFFVKLTGQPFTHQCTVFTNKSDRFQAVNTLGHLFTFQHTQLSVLNIPPSTVLYRSFYLMCAYFYVSVCCIDCGCTAPPAEEERLKSASVCCVHRPGVVGHTLCVW